MHYIISMYLFIKTLICFFKFNGWMWLIACGPTVVEQGTLRHFPKRVASLNPLTPAADLLLTAGALSATNPRSKRRSPWSPPLSPSAACSAWLLKSGTAMDQSPLSIRPAISSSHQKSTSSSSGALGLIFSCGSAPAVEIRRLFVAPSLWRRFKRF